MIEGFNVTLTLSRGEAVPVLRDNLPVAMDRLMDAQAAMFAAPDAKTDFDDQTIHHFTRGVYGREFRMPAGQTVMSKIHRHDCFFVMLEGEMLIAGNQGKRHVKAGDWFITEPGAKRCVHALTDVRCMTFHGSQERDFAALEAELIEPEETPAQIAMECDLIGRVF